jgi:hypothetical protein
MNKLIKELNELEQIYKREPNNSKASVEWNMKIKELLKIDNNYIQNEEEQLYNELFNTLTDIIEKQKQKATLKEKNLLFQQIFDTIRDKYNKYLKYGGIINYGGKGTIEQKLLSLKHAKSNIDKFKSKQVEEKQAAGGVEFGGNIHTLSSIREDEPESNMSRQILKEGGF